MKKIIAIILCIVLCLSDMTVIMAENEKEETYYTINAEFSDKVGQLEKIQVMVKDDHVYANAEELATRLGYKMASDNECVLVYNQDNETLPYGFTQFYIDDTKVTHTLFTEVVSSYEAPFETIKNDKGAWIPFEYSLLILNSGMMIVDNTILIDIPEKDIIDICFDIVNNNVHYTFEWSKDFGYIEDSFEHKVLTYLSHYINVFNGILQFDGDSWAQFFSEVQLNNSAYHSKYGKDLAMLICTSSNEELEAIINEVEIANDLLGKDKEMIGGKLGGILEKYSGNLDKEVGELYETCEKILEEVKKGNTDVVEYNRSYQALEDALDKQAWFSDLGGDAIMQLQSELSGVMSFLTVGAKMLEIVNYQEEFKNQDEFSVQAFSVYLEDAQRQASIPKETVSSMLEYSEKFQDDLLNYSLSRWWDEIAREIILEEAIGEVLTTKANVILLVWDLASNYIPVLSGGLSAAEKFELTLYASAFQYGAFENSRNYRTQIFADISDITSENLYKLAQYYYIYLKSCYITREAALGSLAGKMEIDSYREKLQPLVDYQNDINFDITEMLVKLKEAETTNEKLVYGFLTSNNEEYLESYNDDCLIELCNESNRYKVYAEKIVSYEEKYGYAEIIKESDYYSYMKGLCFLKLIDFANDGKEELLLVYQDNKNTDGYTFNYIFEIWGYSNGQIVLLDSDQLYTLDGGSKYVYLTEKNGYIYLISNNNERNSPGHYYYHGYDNGKFGIIREEIAEGIYDGGEECSINGELVSYERFEQEQQEWLNNGVIYGVNYAYSDCIKAIQQNNDTKRQLDSFYFGKIEDIIFLSEDDVLTIAEEYWGIKKGDIDEETGYLMNVFVYDREHFELTENMEYRVDLRWLVDGNRWSNVDSIYVNAITGECRSYY